MAFDMHSFCRECGAHMRRMPFGSTDNFWDRDPCPKCGSQKYGKKLIAQWKFLKGWVSRDGEKITLEVLERKGSNGY